MKKKEQKKEKQFKKVWEKLWQSVIGRLPEVDIKRLFLTNLPYVLVFYVVNKLAWLYQYCQGNSLLERLSVLTLNVSLAFENILPSLRFSDIGVGFTGAVLLKGIVYFKGKNAKKFRQGVEYGSARWGTAKDIAPFMDSVFEKEDIDGVIHFAASSQVGESMKDPLKYYSNNLCGTEVLLESMVAHGIDKIVFSSTAATYGEPESIPILETDPTVPTNCYGETKLSMEKMFHWTSIAHNLRYVSLRYFNACGAHPNGKIGEAHNPETHLIPLILQVPNHQREYISIFGTDYDTKDGTCVRDYIHVNDLAQAHILAMNYLRNGGKSDIFNLGNGVGFTVKEVVETAREVTGHPIPAKEEARRAGDPSTLIASSGRAGMETAVCRSESNH